MSYVESDFQFARQEGPIVFLQEWSYSDSETVYVYADLPDDARAVCALRSQGNANGIVYDETYTMEAEPDKRSLYRFVLERIYPEENVQKAEELTPWVFQCTAWGQVIRNGLIGSLR